MAFSFGPIVIDRILHAVAEDFSGNLLYRLTQLQDATLETTAESKDAVDAQGTLIKRFYTSKSVTFTATNAVLDLDVLGEITGSGKEIADTKNTITMPRIMEVSKADSPITLPEAPIDGTVIVAAISGNGTLGTQYEVGTAASATEFVVSGVTLTLPTDTEAEKFLVKYEYNSTTGVKVTQVADKFPGTVKLTLSVLCVDPCSADTLRHAYVILPSFQVSPEVSISMTTDATFEFTGEAQVSYCSDNKELFTIIMSEDDIED